jgi:endo-1,4-beta-mannosidase
MTIWPWFHPDPNWVSPAHLDRLGTVMDAAAERNLDVLVTAFCGWLSGHAFHPGWERNRDFFTDEFINQKQEFYLRELAKAVAHRDNFMGFDLGNELNCCWGTGNRTAGDAWSKRMLDLCAQVAPQGVHVNGVNHAPFFKEATFSPEGLARTQEIISLHAWVEFTHALKRCGPLEAQSIHLPAGMTALAKAYANDASKPVWIQEFGASEAWMPTSIIPEFMERSIRSAAAAGATWFTWWCSHDISRGFCLEQLEYTLGLMTVENRPKPQAQTFRNLAEEFRAKSPADVRSDAGVPAPPSAPKNLEATWAWLEDWIGRLPENHPA